MSHHSRTLFSAIRTASIDSVRSELRRTDLTAESDDNGDTLLHAAIGAYRPDCVAEVLQHAMRIGEPSLSEILEARNKNGYTPLHCAVLNNDKVTCNLLLEAGAQIHSAAVFTQNTSLHLAVGVVRDTVLAAFLSDYALDHLSEAECQTFKNAKNVDGLTASDLARSSSHTVAVLRDGRSANDAKNMHR